MSNVRTILVALAAAAMGWAFAAQPFDYYVLSLSWAPAFCAQAGQAARNPQECAAGKGIGFIVHGLWPEDNSGRGPESCGGSQSVPQSVQKLVLPYMFSPSLIQHEWTTHGVCTGLSAFDFFSDVIQARASVQIPVQITSIDNQITEGPSQIESQFGEANPTFPKGAFQTECTGPNFEEERVCFDKNLKPQACTAAVGECKTAAIAILPPR